MKTELKGYIQFEDDGTMHNTHYCIPDCDGECVKRSLEEDCYDC